MTCRELLQKREKDLINLNIERLDKVNASADFKSIEGPFKKFHQYKIHINGQIIFIETQKILRGEIDEIKRLHCNHLDR